MANVKNFGLIGVGSELQFGKASSKLINNAGNFNFRAADGTTPVALSGAGITSSAGNVTLTTGNVVLSSNSGTVGIGGDTTLQRQAAGVLQLAGSGAFMAPVGANAARPTGATGMIRVNNESTPVVEFYDGSSWTTLGSSGAVTSLQTEVNAIETSLGAGINTDGTFNGAGFTGAGLGSVTSFTNAINTIADAAAAKDTLEEIEPVGASGNIIYADSGSTWAQAAPGATSGVQGYDAGLAALAVFNTNGILVQTADNTFAGRTLVAPAAGITITDAGGVAGNPTFALANDLAGVEGLATTGYAVRTGDGTWTTRTITGASGRIALTNGDGVSSNTDIDLATVTNPGNGGTFVKVTTDAYGRVSNSTAVVAGDITALVDGTYVNVAGDTMTGNLAMGTNFITVDNAPSADTQVANKAYVDSVASGLSWKTAVIAATTANGVLATDFENGDTLDGVTLATGNRILIKNQTTAADNGIYVVQASGAPVRSTDADSAAELDSATVFVQQGTTNADTGWTQTATIVTVGTTAQVWSQFSGSNAYTWGTGLGNTGNTVFVKLGAGIAELPSDEIGIDVASGKAVQLTGSATGDQLTFVLDAGSGMEQSGTGLKISAGGVTNAMLANSTLNINTDAGSDPVSLGETLLIAGTSGQGISTASTANTVTITAANASSSQKGVATFDATEFTVTAGNVVLGTIPSSKLNNNSVTFTGTSGSDAVALGESMAIIGADSMITTTMGANSLSIQLATVNVAHGGTGLTTLTANQLLIGNGTSAVAQTADLSFDDTINTLTLGTSTIAAPTGGELTITATGTNADINLVPNGTGSVVIGPAGAGLIQSDAGQALTVKGNTTLTLESVTGDTTMVLPSGTGSKVTISGPTAADYATSLAANDLVNKQYVDDAIASGAAAGSVKVVKATVSLASAGSVNVGASLPAGASILRVKVQVTAADTGTGTLAVGKAGGSEYMTASENDTQTTGIYVAETYVVEASSVQVQATVAGTPAGSGSCVVIVEYQVA